jgi:hypothetical protein
MMLPLIAIGCVLVFIKCMMPMFIVVRDNGSPYTKEMVERTDSD